MAQWFQWLNFRSNSKASYLPRQSLEKLNNTDPDHGIYKLTLTSNEDLVAHTKPSYGVSGKLPNNLPDVLPLGVHKLQHQPKLQPGSPNGDANVTLRYGSNNNLSGNSPTGATPPYYASGQRYSTPALVQGYGKSPKATTPQQQYTRSQSYDVKHTSAVAMPPMSQSHVDLKQAVHDLETTLEEVLPTVTPTPTPTPPRLSPASSHSDCSLSTSSLECTIINPIAAPIPKPEAHIFRAEVISTTLNANPKPNPNPNQNQIPMTPPSAPPPPVKPAMNRQESLRENIEKITQLQSQLMSAHLCDTGLLGGYSSPLITSPTASFANEPLMTPPPPPLPSTPPPEEIPPVEEIVPETECEIKELQLMQRSELILMVNPKPSTTDMACQTDELEDRDTDLEAAREEHPTRTTLQPRQRQPIELDYEQMSRELVKLLPAGDKIADILTPKSCKPTSQYVSNLYNPDVPLRLAKRDVGTSTLMRMKSNSSSAEIRVVSVELQLGEPSGEPTNLIKQKMDELIKHLNQKIGSLKREQQTIAEECSANDKLGQDLFAKLAEKVRPSEASKFRTYVDDVGHITSLLLSLSERLAQTECSLETRQQEKGALESKRDLLYKQLEEAQGLKADIDRRGTSIAGLLGKNLSADMCADYDYFINMKAKLIADARDLAERIKGSEEQLSSLSDALVQSDC
ncbi:protein Shroom isoform X2 [Drosophila ficusphila]|uniref:protein Shroom isoform X2 n=1 Tax=Drosophila ficusphila TaxID=30025 RepID=UPI0007E76977|nr:protein Shroom isoform X2 [Drosophila ficusphila]